MFIWVKFCGSVLASHSRWRVMRKRKPPIVGDRLVLRAYDSWQDRIVRVTRVEEYQQETRTRIIYHVELVA